MKTIPVEDSDHNDFTRQLLAYANKIGKKINQSEFFKVLLNAYKMERKGKP